LARRLGRDEEKWDWQGCLHDLDIERVKGDLTVHGLESGENPHEKGVDATSWKPFRCIMKWVTVDTDKGISHALAAGDETITGLITAPHWFYPDKN